ncbi:MAG: carboxy terminal-processing peptidase [Isosphaeraceae bacterium]
MSHFSWHRPRGVIAVLGTLAGVVLILGAQAPGLKPKPEDDIKNKLTARVVVALLENNHLAKPTINEEISKKWARNFLKKLDPLKHYFLKSDVDEFLAQDTTLASKIKNGDIKYAQNVLARFVQRHDERYKDILALLDQKPDYTVDEVYVDDPDQLDYPKTADEAKERWRKLLKLRLLQMKVSRERNKDKDEKAEDPIDQLKVEYKDASRMVHQWDTEELLERYLTALTETIDPHSEYMGPKQLEDFMNQALHLKLEGIGATLGTKNGLPYVSDIVPGGAADKDGRLQIDDKIVGIESENGEEVSFAEKKLNDVVRQIRGPKGTKVKLIVQPDGTKDRKVYELTRQVIELVEQHAKGKVEDVKGANGKALKVGVIDLPGFYGNMDDIRSGRKDAVSATADCRRLIEEFKKQGIDCVVLDLRNNGGGLLEEAISLSGLFIDRGPVVQVKDARGVSHRDDNEGGVAWEGPLVVLTNRLSASASEIFAGVIKDYDRGLLVGDVSTFGKGSVQNIMVLNEWLRDPDLPDLGGLRLTIQQFYRANGESTQIRGVEPHIHLPSLYDQMDQLSEGKMESAMKWDKVDALPHDQYKRVPGDLVDQITKRSEARRQANPKFQRLEKAIAKLIERKQRHEIALNEEKYKAEALVDDEDESVKDGDLAPKSKKKKKASERTAWESNYYNDEIMSIVGDYLSLGSKVLASTPIRTSSAPATRR